MIERREIPSAADSHTSDSVWGFTEIVRAATKKTYDCKSSHWGVPLLRVSMFLFLVLFLFMKCGYRPGQLQQKGQGVNIFFFFDIFVGCGFW